METQTQPTQYISPTVREIMRWQDAGLCMWCGGKCSGSGCRLRFCDSCTEYWIADTEADYREFDGRDGQATVAPRMEDCPPCVEWWSNLHLENPAPEFAPADWMESDAVAAYRLQRMKEAA